MGGFGLLGERLSHSFSPQIHKYFGDYTYKLYELSPDKVADFVRNGGFDGLNVTIPYKKTAFSLCDVLSDEALRIGSVNTIIREQSGKLRGENTDYYGFSYMLKESGAKISGKKALILGSGGASLTVSCVLRDLGAGESIVISRSGPDNYENLKKHADAQIIVNTTPVGMYPDNGIAPVSLAELPNCEAVLDIVYNPARTALLLDAEDRGIKYAGGLPMLVAQAKRAAELFTGRTIPDARIFEVTAELWRRTKNIALIGMPGCGKSAVGRELVRLCHGRAFFDIDEIVEKQAGKSIERIFAEEGEDVFRTMETSVLTEVSAKSCCVIATGGGIVKNTENRRLLRQNSTTVFIDRDISKLPIDGRPLSRLQGVQKLYSERLPLYIDWGDYTVKAGRGVRETARAVMEALGL